jgi:cell wall-associated NlpC family hydrolase
MSARPASATVLLGLLLAGCGTSPERRAPEPAAVPASSADDDQDLDGSGGASAIRNRGDEVVAVAMSLRGARYRYGGATPAGFDCSGLVFYAHRQLGLEVPRTSREQAGEAEQVEPRKLEPGDLVFFKIDSRSVNHVGIYVGKQRFVHAPGAGKPVTVNSLDEDFYAQTFSGAGRYWDRRPR